MYQITINRNDINTPVDMRAIETALLSAGIDFELGERDFESSDPIEVIWVLRDFWLKPQVEAMPLSVEIHVSCA